MQPTLGGWLSGSDFFPLIFQDEGARESERDETRRGSEQHICRREEGGASSDRALADTAAHHHSSSRHSQPQRATGNTTWFNDLDAGQITSCPDPKFSDADSLGIRYSFGFFFVFLSYTCNKYVSLLALSHITVGAQLIHVNIFVWCILLFCSSCLKTHALCTLSQVILLIQYLAYCRFLFLIWNNLERLVSKHMRSF